MRPMLPTADQVLPYLRQIDATRIYSNFGALSKELQSRLARMFGTGENSVTCTSSGTSALIGAILATAGAGRPSRPLAMIPGLTFPATATAAERCGYDPYLVDVDPKSWLLDPQTIASHPRLHEVGLVIPVATFGSPVPQEPWLSFMRETSIPVVIDGAASFAFVSKRPSGFMGKVPVALSFHATKSFGVGEGGCVVWSDPESERRLCEALNFGFYNSRLSVASSSNGKMSEYHAAVGLAELDNWPVKLERFPPGRPPLSRSSRRQRFRLRSHSLSPYGFYLSAIFGRRCGGESPHTGRSWEAAHRVQVLVWLRHTVTPALPQQPT